MKLHHFVFATAFLTLLAPGRLQAQKRLDLQTIKSIMENYEEWLKEKHSYRTAPSTLYLREARKAANREARKTPYSACSRFGCTLDLGIVMTQKLSHSLDDSSPKYRRQALFLLPTVGYQFLSSIMYVGAGAGALYLPQGVPVKSPDRIKQ